MSAKKINRRSILKLSALTSASALMSSPVQILLHSLLSGLANDALAQDSGVIPRSYVLIQLPGAPPRWTWDPLINSEADRAKFVKNIQVATRLINNGKTLDYATAPGLIEGMVLPWMWQFDVAASNGGRRPMKELLKDMMILRGISCGNPGHNGATVLQTRPSGLPYSLMSLSADSSGAPIPYIGMKTRNIEYISRTGAGGVDLNVDSRDKPLDVLLKPFMGNNGVFVKKNQSQINEIDRKISAAIKSLGDIAIEQHPGSEKIIVNQKLAIDLFRGGFSDMTKTYNDLQAKYKALMFESKINKYVLKGINDHPINAYFRASDRKDGSKRDIRAICETRAIGTAEQFAVTEFVLKNKLTSSIAFGVRGHDGFDEHTFDPMTSLFHNTMLNRVLASSVLELKDQLISKNLWDNTVINIAGEFGRNPRNGAKNKDAEADRNFGSDHCPQSGSATLISGCLKGHEVIGNINKNGMKYYTGTFGYQAENFDRDVKGNKYGLLTNANLANTLATALRVNKRPLTAGESLLKEVNGVVSSRLGKGKIV